MSDTIVINIKRKHPDLNEWRRNGRYVYIGRPSVYGNPFSHYGYLSNVIIVPTQAAAVEAYRQWVRGEKWQHVEPTRRKTLLKLLVNLRGKVLGCYCKPGPCHGDVLLELLEEVSKST